MCGIAGIFTPCEQQLHHQKLADICLKMISTLEHRGPESEGVWRDQHVALGYRGLVMQGLSACWHQP